MKSGGLPMRRHLMKDFKAEIENLRDLADWLGAQVVVTQKDCDIVRERCTEVFINLSRCIAQCLIWKGVGEHFSKALKEGGVPCDDVRTE